MTKQPFEGKNLDEAIAAAAREFGVETYQLTYHIAVQKRGFLGGTKRVVIEAEPSVGGEPETPPRSSGDPVKPTRQKTSSPGTETLTAKQEAGGDGQGRKRRRRPKRRRESRVSIDAVREHEDLPETPAPEQGERTEAQRAVAAWIETVIELSEFALVVRTEENEEEIIVRLHGRDQKSLTAKGGELLDSFQVLINKAFVGRTIEKRIELDVETFKTDRELALGEKARQLAEAVKREGVERLLPAMSPIERRIVHIALRDDEAVETVSRGNSFLKRVAIVPRNEG